MMSIVQDNTDSGGLMFGRSYTGIWFAEISTTVFIRVKYRLQAVILNSNPN
jgi:hypothetical protein